MIKITIKRDSKQYKEFRICGHAEYDDYGSDIVCASISILAISTVNALDAFTDADFVLEQDPNQGLIHLTFHGEMDHDTKLLMDALVLGIQSTAEEYGTDYIQVIFEEV